MLTHKYKGICTVIAAILTHIVINKLNNLNFRF